MKKYFIPMVYVRVDLTFNYNYNNASENIEQNMYTVDFFVSSGLYNPLRGFRTAYKLRQDL